MKGYHEVNMSIWHALMVGMTCIVIFKTHPSSEKIWENCTWFDLFKHEPNAMVIDCNNVSNMA